MQDRHIFLGLDSTASLAVVEYAQPYIEYRNPVNYAIEREYDEPRFILKELGPISSSVAGAAEQTRSKLFQIARQNLDCTLTVDMNGVNQPVAELFHHLPRRAAVDPVTVAEGSGQIRVGDQWRLAKHDLMEALEEAVGSGKLGFPSKYSAELLKTSCAAALAVWSAQQHEKRSPKAGVQEKADGVATSTKQSGWGKVRLL